MTETQESINAWADSAFGASTDWPAAYHRVIDEIGEFICACARKRLTDAAMEAADVAITLYRFAAVAGFDLQEAIDAKMSINRQRRWVAHGDGTGHHVKDC